MEPSEITRQTLSAWDEIIAEEERERAEAAGETPEPSPEEEPKEADEAGEEEQEDDSGAEVGDEDDDEEDAEEEGEDGDAEHDGESAYETEDIEVRAFLDKYGGDLDKALKGAAELAHVLGRQGMEKTQLQSEVEAMREEIERLRLVAAGATPLTEEQRAWVEQAVTSGNPAFFVQQAVDAGEFDLAKNLCQEWGREDPFNARRVADQVDQIEEQARNVPQYVDHERLLAVMVERDPQMRGYEEAMIQVVERLGAEHVIVQDARSNDLNRSISGLQAIYELAKASRTSVKAAREEVRTKARAKADRAKADAVVTSGNGSVANGGTPRSREVMPGLTFEALEAAFAEESQ